MWATPSLLSMLAAQAPSSPYLCHSPRTVKRPVPKLIAHKAVGVWLHLAICASLALLLTISSLKFLPLVILSLALLANLQLAVLLPGYVCLVLHRLVLNGPECALQLLKSAVALADCHHIHDALVEPAWKPCQHVHDAGLSADLLAY
eukprot:1137585-Pelagomonas_calceolata.AAC.4